MDPITLFQDANYAGASQTLTAGQYDFADGTLKSNDTCRSIRVPAGMAVRLFEHSWFQGRYLDITMDTPALPTFWNDRASSVIVHAAGEKLPVTKQVVVFTDANYTGGRQILKLGNHDSGPGGDLNLGRAISSVMVPRGLALRLFDGANCTGASIDILCDTEAFAPDWNDRAVSVSVLLAPVGLAAQSTLNVGVVAESTVSNALLATSHADYQAAVLGVNDNNTDKAGPGVMGRSRGTAVWGESETWMGVFGVTHSVTGASGVYGVHLNGGCATVGVSEGANGIGIFGKGARAAGRFEGHVEVTGNIDVAGDIRLTNADCAEDFNIGTEQAVEPGSVMVLGEDGALYPCREAADQRVVGVVSGAGDYKPGIVLDRQASSANRQPIALMGKVFCKVDAQYGAIRVGDLLTTSATQGHAMKCSDPARASGAVIGKAMRAQAAGTGLIPVLVAPQ